METVIEQKKQTLPAIKFGTDGWRDVIAQGFTVDNVRFVSHAVAKTFESEKPQKVFIGYDHRFMAEEFAKESARILCKYKFEPYLLPHAVTSPMLSFITWKEKAPFGVMITASHNPPEYLGFKVKGSFGGSIPQSTAQEIEKNLSIVLSNHLQVPTKTNHHKIEIVELQTAKSPTHSYFQYLKRHIDCDLLKKMRLSVTFDTLYGPGGTMVEQFFQSFDHRMTINIIHKNRDPLFGGLHPEPIEEYLQELKSKVKEFKSSAGFALDGDADRIGLVDERSRYLTPPQVFALLLFYLASEKKLKGKVVQAVSLGYLSERIAQDFNLPLEEVSVGFKHVAEKMIHEEVIAGGEESGGYAFSKTKPTAKPGSILPERDGILCSLLFLEMLCTTGKKIGQLLDDLQKRYGTSCFMRNDKILERPIEDKTAFIAKIQKNFPRQWFSQKVKEMRTADGFKAVMEDGSWILVRPSGTEPLLRTYAEFPNAEATHKSLAKVKDLIDGISKK